MSIRFGLAYLLGTVTHKCYACMRYYENRQINKHLGGGKRIIQYPFRIEGVDNIVASEPVNIGTGATIFTTGAKLRIEQHFVSGPNLTIITGDHYPVIGFFTDTVSAFDKMKYDIEGKADQDVIIEEDVWCGANVTILKGVTIGRGSIIAAGAVVTRSIPPYSIVAGVPAKPIKTRLSIEQILEHEKSLYSEDKRFNKELLERTLYHPY